MIAACTMRTVGRMRRVLAGWSFFARDRSGAAILEFALAFPFLALLALGGFEIGRYVLLQEKLESLAVETADLVSQAQSLTSAQLDDVFQAAGNIMSPFSLGSNGVIVVTSVSASGGQAPIVNWQRSGGGTGSGASLIGTPGQAANLPSGFTVRDGESLIVAEVFYHYAPILNFPMLPITTHEIYSEGMFRPRFSALTTIN